MTKDPIAQLIKKRFTFKNFFIAKNFLSISFHDKKKKKFIPIKLDINCKWILLSLLHSLLTLKCKFGASAIVDLFCLFFPIFISLSFVSLFSISWFISLKKKIITWTRRSKIRLNPIDRKAMEGRRGSKNSRKILRKKKKKNISRNISRKD